MRAAWQKLYDRIRGSSFLKSVLTLSSGVVVGQAVNFVGMPFVSRIYTPAAMGDYTVITANAGVIMAVACLGMMTVFMLPENDEEARGLARLVTYSTVLISAAAVVLLWCISGVYRIFHTEETSYALSLSVLWLYTVFYTISNICYAYVNRRKLYRVMFWNPIITAGINVGLGIVFGLMGQGFVGYTLAHILSFGANILHLVLHANPYERISDPTYRCMPLLKSYRRFPIYQMPANLVSSLGTQISVQTMEAFFSAYVLGLYSMTNRILTLPATLLAVPVNRVFFQEASQRFNRGEDIGEFSFKIIKTNVKLAILPISVLMIFGEWIFAFFLGEQWRGSGTYASILGIFYLVQFCGNCISGCFVILRKNRVNLIISIITLATTVLLYGFARWGSPDVMVFLPVMALLSTLCLLITQGYFLKLAGFPLRRYLGFVACYIVAPVLICQLIRKCLGLM